MTKQHQAPSSTLPLSRHKGFAAHVLVHDDANDDKAYDVLWCGE